MLTLETKCGKNVGKKLWRQSEVKFETPASEGTLLGNNLSPIIFGHLAPDASTT